MWWPALTCYVLAILQHAVDCEETIQYSMVEELPVGSNIGNVVDDAALRARYDAAVLRRLTFSFLDNNGPHVEYMTIDSKQGLLRTARRIDRDTLCPKMTTCEIASNIAVRPFRYFQIIKVKVVIIDTNDNVPTFEKKNVRLTLSETTSPGLVSVLPSADDKDSGVYGIKGYQLLHHSSPFKIRVDTAKASGAISLILSGNLDREKKASYHFVLVAYDGGAPQKSGSALIDIVVSDANDNIPQFVEDNYKVSIFENATKFTTIVKVRATDLDSGPNGDIVYSFGKETATKHGDLFGINRKSGAVFLKKQPAYELGSMYKLSVIAKDRGPQAVPAITEVAVKVKDVNDHAPEISVTSQTASASVEIMEDSGKDTFVAHVSVKDVDGGQNGEFDCSVNDKHFILYRLYKTEFKIVTAGNLDRETRAKYTLEFVCQDRGKPPMIAKKHVLVKVLDKNDHAPVFSKSSYFANLRENSPVGSFVVQVNATDRDEAMNKKVAYYLVGGNNDKFAIGKSSGIVTSRVHFDRESVQEVELLVIATDSGEPRFTTTSSLHITVTDVNDEAPTFSQMDYVFGIDKTQPIGTEVGRVFAFDQDTKPYNKFSYYLSDHGDSAGTFIIDQQRGIITSLKSLQYDNRTAYSFPVLAVDTHNPSLKSKANVTILVANHKTNAVASGTFRPNLTIILALAGALGLMLIILATVIIVYTSPRRRNRNRSGYLSGDLVRVRRGDLDVLRKDIVSNEAGKGIHAWSNAWESMKIAEDKSFDQTLDLTVPFKLPYAGDCTQETTEMYSKERISAGRRSLDCGRCTPKRGSPYNVRSERRRTSQGTHTPTRSAHARIVYNKNHGARSSASTDRHLEAVGMDSTQGKDSDSACSADVSNSDSGNCASDEPETRQSRGQPEGSVLEPKEQLGAPQKQSSSRKDKTRRLQADSLSSPDSEMTGSSVSDKYGCRAPTGACVPHRVALVHPQRNGEKPCGSDVIERMSLADSCHVYCGSCPEDGDAARGPRREEADFDSDASSELAPGTSDHSRRESRCREKSPMTFDNLQAIYYGSCVNDTDFYESDSESRGHNIVI